MGNAGFGHQAALKDPDAYDQSRHAMARIDSAPEPPTVEIARFSASLVEGRVKKNGDLVIVLAVDSMDKDKAFLLSNYPGTRLLVGVGRYDYEAENG